MKIVLITTRKEPGREGSVMGDVARHLDSAGIALETVYPDEMLIDVAGVNPDAELYVLKAGSPAALAYAGLLDLAGASIINPFRVVAIMKDKVLAGRVLSDARIPAPETYVAADRNQLEDLLRDGPLIIKPFIGGSQGRGVEIVRNSDELNSATGETGLVFAQRYYEPDGRDNKIYRIGEKFFGVRRVWPARTLEDKLGEPFELTADMISIAERCGEAFGIDIYGLDIIFSSGRPIVVDINTFPGFKGVPDAGRLLAEYLIGKVKK
ncbi:MAG: hypothetical protein KF868_07335 [Acidobacteria bacterium]|nr:hypothetical protein [Acidobacteriota bacterium]MCW5967281.1 hypothetical protein [Blastocatellales bacterium]